MDKAGWNRKLDKKWKAISDRLNYPDDKEMLIILYNRHHSLRKVGIITGLSSHSVSARMKYHDIDRNGRGGSNHKAKPTKMCLCGRRKIKKGNVRLCSDCQEKRNKKATIYDIGYDNNCVMA